MFCVQETNKTESMDTTDSTPKDAEEKDGDSPTGEEPGKLLCSIQ